MINHTVNHKPSILDIPSRGELVSTGGGHLAYRLYGEKAIVYIYEDGAYTFRLYVLNGKIVDYTAEKQTRGGKTEFVTPPHNNLVGQWAFGLCLRRRGWVVCQSMDLDEWLIWAGWMN